MSTKKLILQVVADVSQAKKGLQEVGAGIKGMFDGQKNAGTDVLNGALKSFDGLKGALGRVLPVANAVLDVAKSAIDLAEFAGQREILQRQVSPQTLAALRSATQGLVDDTTLMQAAAVAMRGDFKMTDAQLQQVAAAAVTLHNEGFGPLPEIIADITKMLAQGEVEGLKKYGISVGETGDKAAKMGRAMSAMGLLASSANSQLSDSSTELTKLLVKLKNAFDEVRQAAGAVVGGVAWAVNKLDGLADVTDALPSMLSNATSSILHAKNAAISLAPAIDRASAAMAAAAEPTRTLEERALDAGAAFFAMARGAQRIAAGLTDLVTTDAFEHWIATAGELDFKLNDPVFGIMPKWKRGIEAAELARKEHERQWQAFTKSLDEVMDHRLERIRGLEEFETAYIGRITQLYRDLGKESQEQRQREMDDLLQRSALDNPDGAKAAIAASKKVRDESMNASRAFAHMRVQGQQAFQALAAAAGTNLQAIISGNAAARSSMSELFKQLLDQFGTEMQINALKYLALGTAHLFTSPAQSANEFAAAGIFEAAALLAGGLERGVGAPAASGAGGGGSAGSSANENTAGRDSGATTGGGNVTINNVYKIEGFIGDETALARKLNAAQRKAELSGVVNSRLGARRG